jgi:fructose-1,6-bisphosphatase/inositol monophosphatase family enzyme
VLEEPGEVAQDRKAATPASASTGGSTDNSPELSVLTSFTPHKQWFSRSRCDRTNSTSPHRQNRLGRPGSGRAVAKAKRKSWFGSYPQAQANLENPCRPCESIIYMLDDTGLAAVERLVRRVGDEVVLPLFGALTAGDIEEKSPGDFVTVADRRAEEFLSDELTRLVPGSVVVGEEAVHADASLLQLLKGPAPVWIIDPIDGTEAFKGGSPRFATLVTLASGGDLLASWTYAPLLHLMATATRQGGAFVDGEQVHVSRGTDRLRHLDVLMPRPHWWAPDHQRSFNTLFRSTVSPSFFDYAGLAYVELASGRRTAMLLPWEFPWDHAAGVLLHAEAGGVIIAADGAPFSIAGGNALPLIAAPDAATANALRDALL